MSSAGHTSQLGLIENTECKLTFDPVDVCSNPPSIAFDISLHWNMPFHYCEMRFRESWIEESALRRFEKDLSCAIECQRGIVRLSDMSERPLLAIELEGNDAIVRLTGADSVGMAAFSIAMDSSMSSVRDILQRLRKYPKWW